MTDILSAVEAKNLTKVSEFNNYVKEVEGRITNASLLGNLFCNYVCFSPLIVSRLVVLLEEKGYTVCVRNIIEIQIQWGSPK